jgi:hypothetical protein
MFDRFYLPFLGLAAAAAIAIALVWPQGLGDRSPGPFGHTPAQRTAKAQAAMKLETTDAQRRANEARETVRELQSQALAPSQ